MEKASQNQIAAWKREHGEVFEISVPADDAGTDVAAGYFRKPARETFAFAARHAQSDPFKAGEIMFNGSWLGGDERLKTDVSLYLAASKRLGELTQIREAELKKL